MRRLDRDLTGICPRPPGATRHAALAEDFPALPLPSGWTAAASAVKPLTDLGTLGGNNSIATAVNGAGEVVGSANTAAGDLHAFVSTAQRRMVDLGTLGGFSSEAKAVNDDGQVVGDAMTAGLDQHAFSVTL